MRRHFALIALCIAMFPACRRTSKSENKDVAAATEKSVETVQKMVSRPADLNSVEIGNKIFEAGGIEHFTDSCTFYFECDCCSGELIFNTDSTFYSLDFCLADRVLTDGHYSIRRNALILEFSGRFVKEEYNWEHESDSTQVEYFRNDTIVSPYSMIFIGEICNQKLVLKENKPEDFEMAVESAVDRKTRIDDLTQNGLINRLNKLTR